MFSFVLDVCPANCDDITTSPYVSTIGRAFSVDSVLPRGQLKAFSTRRLTSRVLYDQVARAASAP